MSTDLLPTSAPPLPDATAPLLRDIAHELPFRYAGTQRREGREVGV